jgi:hypothetical protein
MTISGSTTARFLANNRTLNNAAAATLTGASAIAGPSTTTFNNLAGAILDIQSDADMFNVTFVNNGTLRKSGAGDTQISGMFTNNNTIDVRAGILSLAGTFTNYVDNILTGGIYRVASQLRWNNADIVINAAEVELSGPNSRITDYQFTPNDAFRNFATNTESATFHIRDGRNFSPQVPLNNAGTVIVGQNSTFSFSQAHLYVKEETGRLILHQGFFAPSNSYTQAAGLIGGVGSINSITLRITNEADISPGESAGEITINGDYIHDGRLTIELGDPDAGDFDVLHVTGHATLNGTLAIQEMEGYTPQVGDTYTVLTYGSRTGIFNTTEGRDLSNGLVVYDRFFENHLELVISVAGDVNLDGCVDDADLAAVIFNFGATGENLPEDFNNDGIVDDSDLAEVIFNFGSGC